MDDLASRVLAAIDVEEQTADEVHTEQCGWERVEKFGSQHCSCGTPADTRRRCAAERRAVELHTPKPAEIYAPWLREEEQPDFGCGTCHWDFDCQEIMRLGVCSTLKALAEGYGITPEAA